MDPARLRRNDQLLAQLDPQPGGRDLDLSPVGGCAYVAGIGAVPRSGAFGGPLHLCTRMLFR